MRRYTSEDVNEVVEGDPAVSLLGLLEVVSQLVLVVLAQRVELPGDDLLKVGTAPPAHLNINYMFPIALLSFLSVLIPITVCTPIQKLTASTLPTAISQSPYLLLYVFSPSCGYCQQLNP
jgi:hypothetical protein